MRMNDFGYRELIVWQKAKLFARVVYGLVKQLPNEERFALGDQIRRAVVSIASNIAEGNGRASNKDYAHFLSIARGSLFETMAQLEIAADIGCITLQQDVEYLATEIGRMLSTMIKKFGIIHRTPTPQTYT